MPSRPKSIKHPGLTRRQADFAREFVLNGGKRAAAARAAGYAEVDVRVEANRLLRIPAILDAVRKESEGALHASVALGQHVLADLAENAESETVRLAAAQALLDRGGMQLVKRSETTVTVTDQRTDAELLEHARSLAVRLGMANIIDGSALIRPAAPPVLAAPPALSAPSLPLVPMASLETRGAGGKFHDLAQTSPSRESAAKFLEVSNLNPLESRAD